MKKDSPFSTKEFKLIQKFLRDIQVDNGKKLSKGRIKKYLSNLKTIKQKFLKDFEDPSLEDIKNAIFKIENSNYKEQTKRDLKIALRRYLRWLNQNNGNKLDLSWFKIPRAKSNLPEILTEEEVKRLIEATDNIRDRALVSVL